jgi:hypothetical protein
MSISTLLQRVSRFSPTVFGTPQTITLNSTTRELVLNDSHPLSILGPTGDTVTVSGGDAVEVLDVTGGTVSISHLAISHGKSSVDQRPLVFKKELHHVF